MPGDGDLYVFSAEGDDGRWVSPRPVEAVVVDLVTAETDVSEDDVDDLDAYVDRDDLAAHLDGDPTEPLTFTVEGHDVVVDPDGTVSVDIE
ncbi:MAG: HalOD1 output domain-containing protein [Haloarculaceae archaeon]